MSLENLKNAQEFITKIKSKIVDKEPKMKDLWKSLITKSPIKDRKPPRDFKDSSYLYIRSYDGDNGVRPGATGIPYWISPDVNVAPESSLNSYTSELNVGTLYNLECLVHNRGDLIVPSAKVEFYLVTPSLGFDTRYAKKIGITSGWVNCYGSTKLSIKYMIQPDDSGHKCLFARVFSFSPLELPIHDTLLNPYEDRHIGQKNLNILPQMMAMRINILHMPIANVEVVFKPMNREALLATRHPSLKDLKVKEGEKFIKVLQNFKLEPSKKNGNVEVIGSKGMFKMKFNEKGMYGFDEQKRVLKMIELVKKKISSGKGDRNVFKKEIAEFRKMNKEYKMSLMNLTIPDFGLKKGEMVGVEISATNKLDGKVFGGITLFVTG